MISKNDLELADATALNAVLLSVIDPKSWLVVVDAIEGLDAPPETRARLLAQLAQTFKAIGVDPAVTPAKSALLRMLDQCQGWSGEN